MWIPSRNGIRHGKLPENQAAYLCKYTKKWVVLNPRETFKDTELLSLLLFCKHNLCFGVILTHIRTGSSISSLFIHYPHPRFLTSEHIPHFRAQFNPTADGKSIVGCLVLVEHIAGKHKQPETSKCNEASAVEGITTWPSQLTSRVGYIHLKRACKKPIL